MSVGGTGLQSLAERVQAELDRLPLPGPEPPKGLPELALVWLALTPVWTARMAAVCSFPAEAEGRGKEAQRNLESLARADQDDPAVASAAQHALGVVALGRLRSAEAERRFRSALTGHRQLRDPYGVAAAESYLGVLAGNRGDQDAAVRCLTDALSVAPDLADDVARAAVERQLARLVPAGQAPLSADEFERAGIVLKPGLEPLVLEAGWVLERVARSGVCRADVGAAPEAGIEPGGLSECRYWMTDLVRQQVLREVIRNPKRGMSSLQEELRTIGRRVLAADSDGVPVLGSVRRWAELAALAPDIRAMADRLSSQCDRLISPDAQDDPDRSGAVLGLIQAAEPLEGLLKGELTAALDRARRQLDLFHRRRDDDQRYLRHFVHRREQIRAVQDLLPDSPSWALHFVGAGGAGKTMLMRYISSILGPQLAASTARIDFDYLNPEYPANKPGLLLVALAEELRLFADGDEAVSLFAKFDDQVSVLDQQMTVADLDPSLAAAAEKSFAELLEIFGDALAVLPKPVILLIDTCEELAKIRPDGTSPEGVTKTFEVLQELREKVDGLRVIFAGRRALASCGDGWEVSGGDQLPARPYLRLHEIQGFSRVEALRYMRLRGVPRRLRRPILTKSEAPASLRQFVWTAPGRDSTRTARYNPFELSGWAVLTRQRGGEDLTAVDILSTDSDRYIELRILRRIRYEGLKLALPAIGLLGRFDYAVLRDTLPDLPDFEEMFRELKQQEWIRHRGIDFYEVDEALRRRLLAHCERVQRESVERAYLRAARHLEHRTINEPLSDLLPFHFDTAMAVLYRDPERAARWWARAEARFAAAGRYEWARQLVEFMLGPEGACAEPDPSGPRSPVPAQLRAGVLATQMSCFTHTRSGTDRRAGWREVESLLPGYPDPALASALRLRARAGQAAADLILGVEASPEELSAFRAIIGSPAAHTTDPQVLASLVAALEAAVERAERDGMPAEWFEAAAELFQSTMANGAPISPDLAAFAASLVGRTTQPGEARKWFERSIELAEAYSTSAGQPWLDWLVPDDLAARLRLEYIRRAYPAILGPQEILNRVGADAADAPATIDADRLASARLTLLAAMDRNRADGITATAPVADFAATRNAHRAFPPLTIAQAETAAHSGSVDHALELLSAASRNYEQSAAELDSIAHAERAMLRIVRRMRLRDEGRGLTSALVRSPLREDWELMWSLDGLDGAKVVAPDPSRVGLQIPDGDRDEAEWRHARWRTLCASAWDADVLSEFAQGFHPVRLYKHSSFIECSSTFDSLEANRLAEQLEMELPRPELTLGSFTPTGWWKEHRDQPEQALRLMLRSQLRDDVPSRPYVPDDVVLRLGRRRAGEITLDEGEMLALRLPEHARPVLEMARDYFSRSNDDVGALIAQTCAALTMARAGLDREVSDLLSSIAAEDLKVPSFLPLWADLSERGRSPSASALDDLQPPGWRPWLVRIIALVAWTEHSGKSASKLEPLHDWVRDHYGLVRPHGPEEWSAPDVALPAELDLWLESQAPESGLSQTVWGWLINPMAFYRRRWRRFKELRRQGKNFLPPLLQLGLAVAPGAIIIWLLFRFLEGNSSIARLLTAPVAIWVLFAAVPLLLKTFRTLRSSAYRRLGRSAVPARATRAQAAIIVEAPSSPEDDHAALTLEARGRPAATGQVRLSDIGGPYTQLASLVPADLRSELSTFRSEAGTIQRIVELRLDQGLGAPCWEAMLASNPGESAYVSPQRFVRTVRHRHARPTIAWRDVKNALSVLSDLRQDEMATQGWRKLAGNQRYRYGIARSGTAIPGSDAAEAQLVHLVVTPIDTVTGPRLELGRETGQRQRGGAGPPRGRLLKAVDVVTMFPQVVLCVLQATPEESMTRTDAERRQAAVLRLVAEEIFALGVTAVITIPTMPSSVAEEVLNALAEAVTSRPRRPVEALADEVRRAQRRMVVLAGPGVARESAFDLCLYATDHIITAPSKRGEQHAAAR